MIVIVLLAFVSAILVALAVGLFAWTVRQRTFDHSEHLALLPLRGDAGPSPSPALRATGAPRGVAKAPVSRGPRVGTNDGKARG
ncbi:MAG: hypothetical protein CMN30_10970 [Sandaracinus sp.]|nr:hypothetical protein [Sandaracinus sp.]|tara:strand:+ start:524 stop:775 length:252 start_codon:yes stop_codon:yes gene_type:complete